MNAPIKTLILSAVLALAGLDCPVATAGGLAAVSGPNGKLSVEGGTFDDSGAGIALGSFATPLGYSFGLQADGAFGSIDGQPMGGGGLHLFTRDPSHYLLGVYSGYHTWDGIDVWRAAGEAELYVDRFSFSGAAGYEDVSVPTTDAGLPVLTADDKSVFGLADIAYYITDDFKIAGGYRYINETGLGSASAEYLIHTGDVPMSLFANSDFGNDDYTRITGGLRVFLGSDPHKSLIDRHRQDDPPTLLPMFPKLATQSPSSGPLQCTVIPSGAWKVTSPADGQCICPPGSPLAGQMPVFLVGEYRCRGGQ